MPEMLNKDKCYVLGIISRRVSCGNAWLTDSAMVRDRGTGWRTISERDTGEGIMKGKSLEERIETRKSKDSR